MAKYVVVVGLCLLFFGCRAGPPRGDFYSGDYLSALPSVRRTVAENPTGKDYAYHRLFLASVAFAAGNYEEAQQALREALKVMEGYGENPSGEVMALVGSEESKVYKGDPYEKMMAHYYTGLTFYQMKNYPKALAGFANALSADEMSPEVEYKKDCALLHFLSAKVAIHLGREDSAAGMIQQALAVSQGKNPYLEMARIKESNLTILVETGHGPKKRSAGSGQSIEVLVPGDAPEHAVQIFLDGQRLGDAAPMADVFLQAKTGGKSQASAMRETKGIAKDLAVGIPLVQSKADTRVWTFLPARVFAFCAPVAPGNHTITLKFYDEAGLELKRYEQTWYHCPVNEDSLYCFRSVQDLCLTADGQPKSLSPPPVQYCCDAVGHLPGQTPYLLGGKCVCAPTEALLQQYHRDGLLLNYDLAQLKQAYLDRGIHFDDHQFCNNSCPFGPHLLHGGHCLTSPTPGTRNYEEVLRGRRDQGE